MNDDDRQIGAPVQPVKNRTYAAARADESRAITGNGDLVIDPAELESLVQRVPEPVRPMHQPQNTQAEQDDPGERVTEYGVEVGVVGRLDPAERKCQPEQEEQDGKEQRRGHTATAEQQPDQRLHRTSAHLPAHH